MSIKALVIPGRNGATCVCMRVVGLLSVDTFMSHSALAEWRSAHDVLLEDSRDGPPVNTIVFPLGDL